MSIEKIISSFQDLSDMFTGEFKSKHSMVIEWEEELNNLDNIRSINDDKLNLANDWYNIAGDIRKSYEEAKDKIAHG